MTCSFNCSQGRRCDCDRREKDRPYDEAEEFLHALVIFLGVCLVVLILAVAGSVYCFEIAEFLRHVFN